MLIGIDASRANINRKTGTEWYSYYLIRWLAKLDKKNKYILYTDKPLKCGLLDLISKQYFDNSDEKNKDIEIDKNGYQKIKSPYNNFKVKILKWPFNYFWTQGRMSLEMLIHPPDILFVPSHTLPIVHPKKSIVTIHDIGYEKNCKIYNKHEIIRNSSFKKRIIDFIVLLFTFAKYRANEVDYLQWSTKYAIKKAYKIITISNFSKKEIVKFYKLNNNKIEVIYNGYNKFLYKKINDQEKINNILNKYGIEKPYLFYIGRIEKKKNISVLIEAFAILKEKNKNLNHKLVLAGMASYGYDEIKYMIREFDLIDYVIMPGWIDECDIPYLYNGAFAFIFPSNYEGFGIPTLQAMACGVPILASNTSSIPEIVGDSALLFDQRYALSISDAIEKIILDLKLRENLIKKGFERVKNFSWEKCTKETLKELIS